MKDDLSKFFAAYFEYVKSLAKPQATVDVSNNPAPASLPGNPAPVPQMSQPPAAFPGNLPAAQLRPK
jgi:hypothetical protein